MCILAANAHTLVDQGRDIHTYRAIFVQDIKHEYEATQHSCRYHGPIIPIQYVSQNTSILFSIHYHSALFPLFSCSVSVRPAHKKGGRDKTSSGTKWCFFNGTLKLRKTIQVAWCFMGIFDVAQCIMA